ncbi:MAG: Lhr family helicase, partial [Actinomycetota bacterium]
ALPAASGRSRALPVGRWALYGYEIESGAQASRYEAVARQLLRRYGVVFRDLLARERAAPPWRVLLEIYRRLEAQATIRGGRFVSGFVGEQFALPEAVEALRAVRRSGEDSREVIVSAADPLNLVGIILPGARISPFSGLSIAYRNGVAVEVGPLGTIRSRLWSEARSPS